MVVSRTAVRKGALFRQPVDHCDDEMKDYIAAVSSGFCPFIEPSSRFSSLFFSEYILHVKEQDSLCKSIFYLGLIHTEILRASRLRTKQPKENLLCENLIFKGEFLDQIGGQDVLRWPHWLLKILYTDKSLLFGKFWKGEKVHSQDGRQVPIPPVHILSIRCAIKPIDIRFFEITPELLEAHTGSFDDTTAFEFSLSPHSKKVINLMATLDLCSLQQDSLMELLSECERTFLFEDCLREVVRRESSLYPAQLLTRDRFKYLMDNTYA